MAKQTLNEVDEGKEYIISRIDTDDEELDSFLFSLGCYSCVVSIKDARYNIDNQLAEAIVVE